MKKALFIILVITFSSLSFGQEVKTFSFDLGYGINGYNMNSINEFYIDSFAATPEEDLLREYVRKGQYFRIGVNYIPISWLDVGFYGGYQFSSLTSAPWKDYYDSDLGETVYNKGNFELRTEATSVGINSTLYLSELINSKDAVQNKFHYGIELNGGVSFSKVSVFHSTKTFMAFHRNDIYTSQDFHGQLGLKLEYDFTQQPIFTTLGLRAGYQFLKSGVVRDAAGQDWLVNDKHPINLDFSGFYFGVYLKIGK